MSNSLDTKQSGRRRVARGDGALDHGLLPRLVGYQLRLAQLAVFRDFDRATADLGLTPGRFGMLVLIEANPGVTQSALARAVGLDRSTLVALLDQLEDRRLVARRQGEDRRTNGLWLTAAGQRFLGKMKRRVAAHEARVAARLTRAERELLLGALRRLGE
jgi:DNA-binding MarR family transcriptional regulator